MLQNKKLDGVKAVQSKCSALRGEIPEKMTPKICQGIPKPKYMCIDI